MGKYLKLLRVKHYIKNILIFIPLFFAGHLLQGSLMPKLLMGAVVFCLSASFIYIINDIRDVEADRRHMVKCKRPIASGAVSMVQAKVIAMCLILLILLFQYLADRFQTISFIYLLIYIVLNLLYSFGLKNQPIIDITILAAGFLWRVMYGAVICDVIVSKWLCLTVIAFSLYMGMGKRRNEIIRQNSGGETRPVLKKYTYDFLDKSMQMCLTLGLVFYSLWTVNIKDSIDLSENQLIWTVPLVIIICLKYNLIMEGDSEGDPVEVLLSDKLLIILVIIYIILMFWLMYGVII